MPTYLQLVHQVEQSLRLGYLKEGDRLPTVKETVEALAINPNTVLKAYRELDNKGLATGRPGQGTFIAGTLRRVGLTEQSELRKGLMSWLRTADDAGLDFEWIEALFAASMRDFRERRDVASARRGAARRPDLGSPATSSPSSGRTGRARPLCSTWPPGCSSPRLAA